MINTSKGGTMYDIIDRLRRQSCNCNKTEHICKNEWLLLEAADEIERLQKLLEYKEQIESDLFRKRISAYTFSENKLLSDVEKSAMWEGWKLKGMNSDEHRLRTDE